MKPTLLEEIEGLLKQNDYVILDDVTNWKTMEKTRHKITKVTRSEGSSFIRVTTEDDEFDLFIHDIVNVWSISGYHLTCNRCGYKQYDEETVLQYALDNPNECVHDIHYICRACKDTQISL